MHGRFSDIIEILIIITPLQELHCALPILTAKVNVLIIPNLGDIPVCPTDIAAKKVLQPQMIGINTRT